MYYVHICLSVCVLLLFFLYYSLLYNMCVCVFVYCLLLCRTFTCLLTTNAQLNFCLINCTFKWYDLFITMIICFFFLLFDLLSIYYFIEHPKIMIASFRHLFFEVGNKYTYHWFFSVGFFLLWLFYRTYIYFVSMRALTYHKNSNERETRRTYTEQEEEE